MKFNLEILAKKESKEIFLEKNFFLNLKEKFLKSEEKKNSSFLNNIFWFIKKLKISDSVKNSYFYDRWMIVYVDFWINIWTEINWKRPAIIFKNKKFLWWEDIFVIPMTSFKEWKFLDSMDIIVEKKSFSWIEKKSILKIRKIRSVSKRRISKYKSWNFYLIDNNIKKDVINNVKHIFWI